MAKMSTKVRGNIIQSAKTGIICLPAAAEPTQPYDLARSLVDGFPEAAQTSKAGLNLFGEAALGSAFVVASDKAENEDKARQFALAYFLYRVGDDCIVSYYHLRKALEQVRYLASCTESKSVAMPMYLGCDTFNGDWNLAKRVLSDVFANAGIRLELWQKN